MSGRYFKGKKKVKAEAMEEAVKAARSAYGGGKDGVEGGGGGWGQKEAVGAVKAKYAPLPHPRAGGKLMTPREWAAAMPEDAVVAWAEHYVATGQRHRFYYERGGGWTRENSKWRSEAARAVEELPLAQEVVGRLQSECVMSTLERRKKLKAISEAPEHPMKGLADNLKAIELEAKEDAESVQNRKGMDKMAETVNILNMFCLPDSAVSAAQPREIETAAGKMIEADFSIVEREKPEPAA